MAGAARPRRGSQSGARSLQLRKYWPELLTVLVILECTAVALLARRVGVASQIPWGIYYLLWLFPAAIAALVTLSLWLLHQRGAGVENPVETTLAKLRSFDRRSYVELIVPIIVMAPFMASFTTFKSLLESVSTFSADPALSRIDGVFGVQPWQVTHALIGAWGTVVIDRMYFSWLGVSQLMLILVLFVPHMRRERGQVLLTFVISWIFLGVFVATLIPSVGPCYYGQLYHPNVYANLMQRLQAIDLHHHLTAVGVQDRIWADHANQVVAVGSGVSAMPSMHVSIATITALFLRRIGLGWLGAVWLAAITIGSVHLGWHYAADGIVSIAGTILIWKWVALLLREPVVAQPAIVN
jgi:hypothetical protein